MAKKIPLTPVNDPFDSGNGVKMIPLTPVVLPFNSGSCSQNDPFNSGRVSAGIFDPWPDGETPMEASHSIHVLPATISGDLRDEKVAIEPAPITLALRFFSHPPGSPSARLFH